MTANIRGATKFNSNTSVGTGSVNVFAGTADNDVGLLIHSYNPQTQDSVLTGAGGTGWTLVNTWNHSASYRVRAYKKVLAASDAGTTVTFTNTTLQRFAIDLIVFSDAVDVDVIGSFIETTSQANHTGATTPALTDDGIGLVLYCERSSAPSTSVDVPAGFTLVPTATGFAVGNGSCSIAAAVNTSTVATGATLGGGTWTGKDASNNPLAQSGVVTLAVAITESDPITQVGRTFSTSWNVRRIVGDGWSGSIEDLFEVVGQDATWNISNVTVAGRTLSTSWNLRKLTGRSLSTTWNVEVLPPVDPDPEDPVDPGDPGALTKKVVFPVYQVQAGKKMPLSRMLLDRPKSLVKINGEWFVIVSPDQELLEAAENYFIGGYTYLLTTAEAAELALPPEFVEDITS